MVKVYWKPEQPPPSTDKRSFSPSFPDLPCNALIRLMHALVTITPSSWSAGDVAALLLLVVLLLFFLEN